MKRINMKQEELKHIQMYAETVKDSLDQRGEKPQSLLMLNLDHINRIASDLLKELEAE